jgi:propionyl-CoA carboxylase alpha chain
MVTKLKVQVSGRWFTVEVQDTDVVPVKVLVDGQEIEVCVEPVEKTSKSPEISYLDSDLTKDVSDTDANRPAKTFNSPMPGVILSVAVKEGNQINAGDEICVLEAMKMQQTLRAEWPGIVGHIHVKVGQQILSGDPILDLS